MMMETHFPTAALQVGLLENDSFCLVPDKPTSALFYIFLTEIGLTIVALDTTISSKLRDLMLSLSEIASHAGMGVYLSHERVGVWG